MIIFGYRGFAKLLGIVSLLCQRCSNPAAHQVVRRSRWFTLFFIPVIPVYVSRSITCTFCGCQTKVSKADADQLLSSAQGLPAAPAQPPALGTPQPPQPPYQPSPQPPYQP